MKYKFKWKRRFFWRTLTVSGHDWDQAQNKMTLYFENGSLRQIKKWNECELKLGTDWVLVTKKIMEEKAGQEIKLDSRISQ